MADIPFIISPSGLQPTSPATLRAAVVTEATDIDPTLTTNLPGTLIEDILSTDTGALIVVDQAKVDLINSLSPGTSNDLLTQQLGNVYGVQPGQGANGSVFIVFNGTTNFGIFVGFTVGDGTNQYVAQEGAIIPDAGGTVPVFCIAIQSGTFPIPANTVTSVVTSVPNGITVTCNNPNSGTPASAPQTAPEYRAQTLQAGLAASIGMLRFLKTLLGNITGVQPRLIGVRQTETGWVVICGGGDPYAIAQAIFDAIFYLPGLSGSTINVAGITNGNPGVVTTDLNHGLVSGQTNVFINGVEGMTEANGGPYTVHVLTEKTFSFGVNTTTFDPYTEGGIVTPNNRNVTVSINDYPDVYNITFVVPPQQTVAISLIWNTTAINFVSDVAVAQLGAQAITDYVNSIAVGVPINLFELEFAFQNAIADLIPPAQLSRMVFAVAVNGVGVDPEAGTGLFLGDPESYFFMNTSQVSITRG